MQTGKSRRRITVDLGDSGLYRSLKLAAVERDASMREVVVEALEQWLERAEPDGRPRSASSGQAARATGAVDG